MSAAATPIGPAARKRSVPAVVSTVGRVTSRPTRTVGRPAVSTRWAASASAQTLNSAAAVTLPPAAAEPPITTSRPMRAAASGKTPSSRAMLVSGPMAATVTGSGEVVSRSASATTACRGSGGAGEGGSSTPPRPASPCTCPARSGWGWTRDVTAPAATGTSDRPARCSTRRAFSVVRPSSTLPWTVVTRRRSTSGLASASRIATASSMPGSVSITRGRGTRGSSQDRGGQDRGVPEVIIASCAAAAGHDEDEPLLRAALDAAGVGSTVADWADPAVDWAAADAVLVRSTWDYAPRRAEFLRWARSVEAATLLLNPADVLVWNTDKRYLGELAAAGVPVVPTAWAVDEAALAAALDRWPGDVVVKPTVSAGARDTARFGPAARREAVALGTAVLASGRAVMVQPYLDRLDVEGETGLVYLDGVLSHAFGKGALLAGAPLGPGLFAEEEIAPRAATAAQRAVGDAVLSAAEGRLRRVPVYARVDLVPGADGDPVLLELELTEPSLFLATDPAAAGRIAAAVAARLA